MTYVPPEKKQKGGSSSFTDFIYVVAFYLIEGLFIFIGVPVIVLALGVVPIAMYLIITEGGGGNTQWIFYLFGVMIVFFQILALQYFIRKWVLEPNKMTFGEWLRWRFSPKEIKKRREDRRLRSQKMDEWYGGMDRVKMRREQLKEEQSYDLRSEWFAETGDPDELINRENYQGSIAIVDDDESITLESAAIKSEPVIVDSSEIEFVEFSSEEAKEEKETIDEEV